LAALRGKAGELEIGWPVRMASAGDCFYFWDYEKGRLVRMELAWTAEATCQLKGDER
jgi:hypothetical protein